METCCRDGHATDESKILRRCFVCWVTKAAHSHEIKYSSIFRSNNYHASKSQCYVYRYTVCLVTDYALHPAVFRVTCESVTFFLKIRQVSFRHKAFQDKPTLGIIFIHVPSGSQTHDSVYPALNLLTL